MFLAADCVFSHVTIGIEKNSESRAFNGMDVILVCVGRAESIKCIILYELFVSESRYAIDVLVSTLKIEI